MAVTATSPPAQTTTLEVDNASDDQWRMVEDQDWPSQLVSSIEQDTDAHLASLHGDNEKRSPLDEITFEDGDSATIQHRSSQQIPIKMLTRPTSSHEDPAAGFSYAKAKPVKHLDFTRKPKQNPPGQSNDNGSPSGQVVAETSLRVHAAVASNVADTVHNISKAPGKLTPSPKQLHVPVTVLAVPFPNVEYTTSRELEYPSQQTSAAALEQDVQSPRMLPNDVTMIGLVEQQLSETDGAYQQHKPDPSCTKAHQEPTSFDPIIREVPNHRPPSHNGHSWHTAKPSRAPQNTSHPPSKVTKSQRKRPTAGPNSSGKLHILRAQIPYEEEDLFKYFQIKYQQGLRERQMFQAAQQAKDLELQQLRDVSNDLYTQVQDMEQRHNETESQLAKMKAAKPGWELKVKRLSDYLKGLSNDHNRLRDNSRDLRERQVSVIKDKEALVEILREVHQNAEDRHVKSKQLVMEARQDLKMLGQTVQHQQSELHGKHELLLVEQQRCSRLQEQISKFSDGHKQLVGVLSGHRETITSKIDELLSKAEKFQAAVPSESQDYLRPMMEQCITLLHNLQGLETIKPNDLETLKSCMRGYFDGITRSIEACEHSTTMTEAGHRQLSVSMQSQLQALGDNIMTEHTLTEQVMDLREIKASLRERVSATDSALRDARLRIVALHHKDQEQSCKIITLEDRLTQIPPPVDNSLTLLRLQGLDVRNKELEEELTNVKAEATKLTNQFEKASNDLEGLQSRVADTQSQLEEAHRETEIVREEKLLCEQQAAAQLDQLGKDLTESANKELATLRKEQQATPKKPLIEDKLSHVTKQFIIMKADKEKVEQETAQMKESMEGMLKERQRETAFAGRLHCRVAELEVQVQAQNLAVIEVRGNLDAANADNHAKDDYIKILQVAQAKREAEKEAEAAAKSAQTQVPSPSVRLSSQSKNFTRPSRVVEDSQPADNAVVAPAGLLSDPFMGNEYGGSQQPSVTDADLLCLFPGTPLAQTKTLNVNPQFSMSRGSKASPQVEDPRKEQRKHFSRHVGSDAPTKGTSNAGQQPIGSASVFQRPSVNIPRSILKDPRVEKRPAAAAGIANTNMAALKRRKSSLADLGPVIEDSQPQDRRLLGKSRKQSTKGKKTAKDEEMLRRFNRELR